MKTGGKAFLSLSIFSLLFFVVQCSNDVTEPSTQQKLLTPELCSANQQVACSSLAGIWANGTATCRSDLLGFDVSSCVRTGDPTKWLKETVYPAQRDASRWKNAKCNKQDDFVFEITVPPHPSGGWDILLEAGGFCAFNGDGQGGCSNRPLSLASDHQTFNQTIVSDRTITEEADDTDPDFGNMIHVKGHYCSSDMWSGTNTAGVPITYDADHKTTNWMFTGHINYQSMMDILQQRYGLHDDGSALQIFFHAGSAGAWGTMMNSWDMYGRFPTPATAGQLMISTSSAFVPYTWNNPNYPVLGITSPAPLTDLDAFKLFYDNWKTIVYQKCADDNPTQPQICMFGPKMYDYITGPKSGTNGNMDLPMLVFQNRQDQLYMSLSSLPYSYDGISPQDAAARTSFEDQMNVAMGITDGIPNQSSRIKWLYAASDPDVLEDVNNPKSLQPNVHPPLCYLYRSPEDNIVGSTRSLDHMIRDFWHQRGKGPGRGQAAGEVQIYSVDYVTDATGDCEGDGTQIDF